jgi:pimeloyl-ACP methyl ester carboxylesterase
MAPVETRQAQQPTELYCEATHLRYLQAGERGPAVVLLHGWSAFKELWWSTLCALAPHTRAFAPDMPGHGGSTLGDCRRMEHLVERIDRFIAARGLDSIILIGHSMGGNAAVELALRRPQLVQRLVLVAPAADVARLPLYTRAYLDASHGWTVLRLSMIAQHYLGVYGQRIPHNHGGGLVLPALRRFAYHARHDAVGLRATLDALFANPIGSRMTDIRMPTLVITGQFDPLVPPALSRRVAKAIPGAQFAVVPGAGHNPMDERPHEFERILLEFLDVK